MSGLRISTDWLLKQAKTEADATLCRLLIKFGDKDVTEYIDSKRQISRHIEIPAYYLAEWIAENWWPLLWEPRKTEEGDDPGFTRRHSILAAQHGFALPKVQIIPFGKAIQLSASARDVDLADVRFRNSAVTTLPRAEVENELRGFIESVLARLDASNIADTYLHDAWSLISGTQEDEMLFCQLAGALGISPYDVDDAFSAQLERFLETLGERLLLDLCLASSRGTLVAVATVAEHAIAMTKGIEPSTLSPIQSFVMPKENVGAPAYRHGVQAAVYLRRRLGISDTDPRGASRVFDRLKINTTAPTSGGVRNDDEMIVTGAVVRDELDMKVALLQSTERKRRFAAARAVFSAWSSELHESRLLTSAVTRDQQANRAFAAELTAPRAFIRSRIRGSTLSTSAMFDLADELDISADVVRKQAANNGLKVPLM